MEKDRVQMDRVASVPVSESIASLVDSLAERLKKPKKEVVEEAIQTYAATIEEEGIAEFIRKSSGIWKRDETIEETVANARKLLNDAMARHQR
jgi:predicted transcriptional regulator